MKGYSKIKLMNTSTKSKSIDFADQTIKTPRIKKPISIKKSTITTPQEQPKNLHLQDDEYDYNHYHYSSNNNQEQDDNFPMEKLTKSQSATSNGTTTDANGTSNLSSRLKIEKQHSTGRTLQTAVKRAMSIRRSSSVSERYSRIHDQCLNPFDVDDGIEEGDEDLQMKKMKKRSSILKACKRVFGL